MSERSHIAVLDNQGFLSWSKYASFKGENTPSTGYIDQAIQVGMHPHEFNSYDREKARRILTSQKRGYQNIAENILNYEVYLESEHKRKLALHGDV